MRTTLASLLFGATTVTAAANWTIGQTVQTSSGPVEGHPARNASEVSEYLGIPFAQAPIGDLRWAAPVKFAGNDTVNGTAYVSIAFVADIYWS